MYKKLCVTCRYADLDEQGVTIDALERENISVIHVSPAHHFPTGIVMPLSRRSALLKWAERTDSYIIEDEYDSEFRFTGKPIPTLMSIDQNDRVIYVNTFTKTISPAIRISYMVLPEKLAARYEKEMGFYSCTVSAFEQLNLAEFIRTGGYEKHIARMKTYYKTQRNALISAIEQSPFGHLCTISEADSGLHFMIHLKTTKTDAELSKMFSAAGIKIALLSAYQYPAQNTGTLIANYSGTDLSALPRVFENLKKIMLL